ncbi:membrane protein [Candidatus Omnitrophus magneticus]|uniref:Membrane protein n=1 Tax=Candidatus Omnitrophus magneticus TaxID=1609969 RepID=A0A0F0CWI9_9BACT|nr:membrane protein [Candidatus Omnitrophus magneticus]
MMDIWILYFRISIMVQAIISIPIFIGAEVPDRILQKQNFLLAGQEEIISQTSIMTGIWILYFPIVIVVNQRITTIGIFIGVRQAGRIRVQINLY